MIRIFLKENKKAIKTGFKWMSLIFTSLVLIIFLLGFIHNQKPDLELFIIVILSAGVGFPIYLIFVVFLRWRWDYSVIHRNYHSVPFNQLRDIGFNEEILNENSKWKFTKKYLTGMINDFIVDCDINTQEYSKYLIFKFYINHKRITKEDYKRIRNLISKQNGLIDFNWIGKKYHYKKHGLITISDLEKELFEFGDLILSEKIEAFKLPN
jgi:hypothetical protein